MAKCKALNEIGGERVKGRSCFYPGVFFIPLSEAYFTV